jgi:SAM-dependent methyltransferase
VVPPCPLCAGGRSSVWFQLPHATIRHCEQTDCGLGFLAAQPDDAQLEEYYRSLYYPVDGHQSAIENSTKHKAEQHFARLDSQVGLRGSVLLDYGCGVGTFLTVAARNGVDAVGVEFDDVGRALAQQHGLRVEKSIHAFDDGSIDTIYMNDVIEHLRDPVADLREARAKLKPAGSIFVVTMNMRGLKARVAKTKWDVISNPTHLWFYDRTSLRRTLEAAGFVGIEFDTSPVVFEHHGAARRSFQRLLQRARLDSSLRALATAS